MDGCRSGAESRGTAAMLVAALALGGCASGTGAQGVASSPAHARATAHAGPAPAPGDGADRGSAAGDLAAAEALERDQLGIAARGAPNATTRQIATLQQARALYQAFVERAKSHPEMHDAMERSRARILDIDQTLRFLQDEPGNVEPASDRSRPANR